MKTTGRPSVVLLLLAALVCAADPAAAETQPRVGYLPIHGPIDRVRHRLLERALRRAEAAAVDTLLVDIDTDGGAVFYAREMLKLILEQPRAGRQTVAFVGYRAISAGALIAYGHQRLYIADTATIGDIGVIFVGADGAVRFASEKIETVVRALLAQAAEQNGWSRGALLKMTARDQKLYRVSHADGAVEYLIEDDLPAFLAAHPQIDRDDPQQLIVYRGANRLLTLTGREALALGMATGLAPTVDEALAELGSSRALALDLGPGGVELLAAALAGWAPLLAGLALMFLLFEFKTPGVGVWFLLAGVFGGLFLVAQYTLDMIDHLELLLLFAGLLLLLLEFLTLVGGGLLAAAGALLSAVALMMMFMPNEFGYDFRDPQVREALGAALWRTLFALAVVVAGVIGFIALVPRSRLAGRVALDAAVTAASSSEPLAALLGRRGHSRGPLRPGGVVCIDGRDYNARVRHGAAIEPGREIEVVAVEFGELVVSDTDDTDDTASRR